MLEIFFKISKSNLNLEKEFQGRSYDSIVAHTTIVFEERQHYFLKFKIKI